LIKLFFKVYAISHFFDTTFQFLFKLFAEKFAFLLNLLAARLYVVHRAKTAKVQSTIFNKTFGKVWKTVFDKTFGKSFRLRVELNHHESAGVNLIIAYITHW
jgi:hypothetical protein